MNKRNLCAKATSALGVLRMVELAARRDCPLILSYHRMVIETHRGLMKPSTVQQAKNSSGVLLRRRFAVLTLEEVAEIVGSSKPFRGPGILITFDDGYIDNYQIAFLSYVHSRCRGHSSWFRTI